jgi:hypothetical protein
MTGFLSSTPGGVTRLPVAAVTEVGQGWWGVEFQRLGHRIAIGPTSQGHAQGQHQVRAVATRSVRIAWPRKGMSK